MDVPMSAEAAQSQGKRDRVLAAAASFHEFLGYWRFRDQRTGDVTCMGESLWDGQRTLADEFVNHKKVYSLKARQLGISEVSCAWDGWKARFGPPNGRVHLFSQRDLAAIELLGRVTFGLDHLPEWMRLPTGADNNHIRELVVGPDDIRHLEAYPTQAGTGVGVTAIHSHIDELARMSDPEGVYQAIEPTLAGTAHIMTTGLGPQNFSGRLWMTCLAGDSEFHPVFIDALQRPDRDEEWYRRICAEHSETHRRQEYPMTWEDALFGGGAFQFDRENLDRCCHGGGPEAAEAGHRYSIGWDIGRHRDAAVGVVVDLSTTPHEVVQYRRFREVPYPMLQKRIEEDWEEYGGHRCRLLVEKNGPGEAVLENLELPASVVEDSGFSTSKPSKAKIIENLTVAFQNASLVYSAKHWQQLDSELRGYTIPDDDVVQDSVMALAIAYSESYGAPPRGRHRRIISW